eukprot:scaffold2162_cov398-Prasinococcus_capsulatus_cf.AAC.23
MALRGRCLLLAGVSSVLLLDSQLTYAQQSNADGIAIGVPYVAQTSLPQLQLSPSAIKWQYELQTQQQQEHQQAPVESFSPPSFKGEAVGWLDIFVASTHNIDTFEIELELYSPIAGPRFAHDYHSYDTGFDQYYHTCSRSACVLTLCVVRAGVEIDVQATDGGLAQLCQFKTITDMLNLPEPPSSDNTADGVMTQQDSYTQATALIFGVSKQLQGDSGTSNDIGKTNGGTGDVSELLCPGGSIPATSAKTSTFVVSMPSGSSADPNEEVLQVLKTSNPSDDAKENALQWLTTLQVTIRAEHAEQGSGKTNDSHQSEPEVDLEWAQPEDVHKFLQAKLKQVSFEVYSCSDNDSDSAEDCNSTNVVDVALLASDGNSLSHVGDVATSMVLAPPMLDASEDVTNSDEKPEPLASLSVASAQFNPLLVSLSQGRRLIGSLIVFDTGCENCDSQPPVLPVWIQTDDNLLISQFVLKLTDTMGNPIGVLKASSGLTSTFNFKVYLQQQQHDNVHVDVGEVDAEASFFPMQVTSVAPSTNALSKQMLIALTLNDSESADGSSSSLDSLLQECEAASFMNCVCLQAIVLAPSVASGEYYASEATQQHKLLPVSVDNSQACDNLFASATSPWNPFEDPAMAMLIDGNGNDDGIYNGNSGNSNGDGTDSNLKAVTMASVLSTSQSFGHYWEFVSSHSFEASVGNGLPEQQPQAPAVLDPPLRTVFAPLDFALEQSGEASEMLSVTVPSSAAQATFQMHGATAQLQPSTFANGVVVQSASGVSMLVEEAGELGDKFSICGVIVYVNSAITTQDGVIYPLGGALSQEVCRVVS